MPFIHTPYGSMGDICGNVRERGNFGLLIKVRHMDR